MFKKVAKNIKQRHERYFRKDQTELLKNKNNTALEKKTLT